MTKTIAEPMTARSRRTRASLLAAARAILEEQGFEALTMTAIAEWAGVTRRAAYMHFTSRAEVVGALFDYIAEEEGLTESLRPVWTAPDGPAALERWAEHLARYHPKLLAIDRALQRVRHHDADAAAHYARVISEQLHNCHRLARRLHQDGQLANPWTVASARDMLFALISSDLIGGLVEDRNWSRQRLATHLSILLQSTFVTRRR